MSDSKYRGKPCGNKSCSKWREDCSRLADNTHCYQHTWDMLQGCKDYVEMGTEPLCGNKTCPSYDPRQSDGTCCNRYGPTSIRSGRCESFIQGERVICFNRDCSYYNYDQSDGSCCASLNPRSMLECSKFKGVRPDIEPSEPSRPLPCDNKDCDNWVENCDGLADKNHCRAKTNRYMANCPDYKPTAHDEQQQETIMKKDTTFTDKFKTIITDHAHLILPLILGYCEEEGIELPGLPIIGTEGAVAIIMKLLEENVDNPTYKAVAERAYISATTLMFHKGGKKISEGDLLDGLVEGVKKLAPSKKAEE